MGDALASRILIRSKPIDSCSGFIYTFFGQKSKEKKHDADRRTGSDRVRVGRSDGLEAAVLALAVPAAGDRAQIL